jgi:hypothetical protein
MVHRRSKSNLLQSQRIALQTLQASTDTIVVHCDKNLGPACIDIPTYIKLAHRDHLHDNTTYRYLTEQSAQSHGNMIQKSLKQWIDKWKRALNKHELRFIRRALKDPKTDSISTLHLLMKIHKSPTYCFMQWHLTPSFGILGRQ